MSEYQIAKDMLALTQRVETLEQALDMQRGTSPNRDVPRSPTPPNRNREIFTWRHGDNVQDKAAPLWWYRIGWESVAEDAEPHSITIGRDGYIGVFITDCYYVGRNTRPERNLKLQLAFKDGNGELLFTYTPSLLLKKDDPHVRWAADYNCPEVASHFNEIEYVHPLPQI